MSKVVDNIVKLSRQLEDDPSAAVFTPFGARANPLMVSQKYMSKEGLIPEPQSKRTTAKAPREHASSSAVLSSYAAAAASSSSSSSSSRGAPSFGELFVRGRVERDLRAAQSKLRRAQRAAQRLRMARKRFLDHMTAEVAQEEDEEAEEGPPAGRKQRKKKVSDSSMRFFFFFSLVCRFARSICHRHRPFRWWWCPASGKAGAEEEAPPGGRKNDCDGACE